MEKDIFAIHFQLLQSNLEITTGATPHYKRLRLHLRLVQITSPYGQIAPPWRAFRQWRVLKHMAQFLITDGPYRISVDWVHDATRSRSDS